MFRPIGSRVSFPALEEEQLRFWKERDVFHKTETPRQGAQRFMLFEGPPTINGAPGIHHVLARVFKDVIPRYKTMKGFYCTRKAGWDTHGLPVELAVEKQLKLTSKRDIERYGIDKFNQRCRESVKGYLGLWEAMTERVGFWVDMEHPYVTFTNDYIETVWWIIKQLYDTSVRDETGQEHRFVYEDFKVTPHCPRCETSLSSHEVALGYEENTPDPSVYIKFKALPSVDSPLKGDVPTYFLAWTTTPWTLPGNTALAVAPDQEYAVVEVERDGGRERLVLATALVDAALRDDARGTIAKLKGSDLIGLTYEPLYNPWDYGVEVRRFESRFSAQLGTRLSSLVAAQKPEGNGRLPATVVASEAVSMDEGTGIVHTAPAFGEEDFRLGRANNLYFVQQVDLRGNITGTYPFAGKFVKKADPEIMKDLEQRGLLYRHEVYRHTYPFCWRCDTPLLYYAKSSWYIRTTAVKDRLVAANSQISWYPSYIKEGRFGEWLRNNVDWSISRERYWGTPIPIWRCTSCGETACVGSKTELKQRAVPAQKAKVDGLDLHRPFVDEIEMACAKCGGTMRRIPELMDVWFDSGAMPLAQWHYPFQGKEITQDGRYPADYICEAVDQTRGWFYSLHAIATLLERATNGQITAPSFENVICLGLILDEKGQKMSKRLGNIVAPEKVISAHGADAVRWYLFTASPAGEPRRFSASLVEEVVRRFMLTLWNTYSFFVTYANLDKWRPEQAEGVRAEAELDRWILSELNQLIADVDRLLGEYNPTDAGRRIEDFVEVLSNWYVRRSRRRFWKSENDQDKLQAYATLYRCLTTVSKLVAPLMPFLAEEMYRNLVAEQDGSQPESVHLSRFPEADTSLIDRPLMDAARLAMRVSSLGRAARAKSGVKVRQPLPKVTVALRTPEEEALLRSVTPQVLDELNVKAIAVARPGGIDATQKNTSEEGGYAVALDTTVTPELEQEGLARELVHRIQNMRRSAGFELMDRIVTVFQAGPKVRGVMESHGEYIRQETLSEELREGAAPEGAHTEKAKLAAEEVTLAVKKVS